MFNVLFFAIISLVFSFLLYRKFSGKMHLLTIVSTFVLFFISFLTYNWLVRTDMKGLGVLIYLVGFLVLLIVDGILYALYFALSNHPKIKNFLSFVILFLNLGVVIANLQFMAMFLAFALR